MTVAHTGMNHDPFQDTPATGRAHIPGRESRKNADPGRPSAHTI